MKGIVALLLLAAPGVVEAGTNYPALLDYPAPSCAKPEKPNEVAPFRNGEDVAAYNKRIMKHNEQIGQYNTALHDYTACMSDYVANAQADMNIIRDKVNKAVAQGKEAD